MAQPDDAAPALDYSERLRRATDPSTVPAELADLAYKHAELRPLIAGNPAAYPGLLDWLGSLTDPAIDAVLAVRDSSPAAATTTVEPMPTGAVPSDAPAPLDPALAKTRRRRLITVTAAGSAVLLVVAGGAIAANVLLTGGGATASAAAFPASTFTWAEVAIDPSISQKLAAAQVLDNMSSVQDLVDDSGVDVDYDEPDIKRSLWDYFFDNGALGDRSSLDYRDDIEPWLGSRIAAGYVGAAPRPEDSLVIAIEASDTNAGVDAVVRLIEDLEIQGQQVSSYNGYVVISDADLDIGTAYDDGDLAGVPAFSSASARLGSWGLGAFWTSPHAAVSANFTWATTNAEKDGELSLAYWEDQYQDRVAEWEEEVAQYSSDCPASATFLSSYCISYFPPTESDFFSYNDFYPGEWKAEAAEAWESAKDVNAQVVTSTERLIGTMSADGAIAGTIRIVDEAIEVVVVTSNLDLPEFDNPDRAAAIAELPDSTIAAVSVSKFGSIVDTALSPEYAALGWASSHIGNSNGRLYSFRQLVNYEGEGFPDFVESGRDNFERGLTDNVGLNIPDELSDAFGSAALIAVDGDVGCGIYDITYRDGDCSEPNAGILIYSDVVDDTVDAIDDVIDNLDEAYDTGIGISEGEGRVAVARGGYADTLLAGGGELGARTGFAQAVPDLPGAFAAAFIDVRAAVAEVVDQSNYYGATTDAYDYFDGISTAGFTASKSGNGDIAIRIRIVTSKE